MIPRYSRPEMAQIWTEENFFSLCYKVELYAAEALAKAGQIPASVPKALAKHHHIDIAKIRKYEETTRHEILAFLAALTEDMGDEARYVHKGLTSSDVLDTVFMVQLHGAAEVLESDLQELLAVLKSAALKYKDTLMIGRTHGIHAEPTTFGLKLLGFYKEMQRNLARLTAAKADISVCAISGAVGNFANLDMLVEDYVAKQFNLTPEPVSTQVIPRDRVAFFFCTLGVIASSVERLATEIRLLQQTELGEVAEFFGAGQKGSSAMPHKSNPVLSENLCGLARTIRGYIEPALSDVALWHERDISHSSAERIIAPDATGLLDFALVRLAKVIGTLKVNPARMQANLDATRGLIYSGRVLLALTEKGMPKDEAYALVQAAAMKVAEGGAGAGGCGAGKGKGEGGFMAELQSQPQVMQFLSPAELQELFSSAYYTRHIDDIFKRAL